MTLYSVISWYSSTILIVILKIRLPYWRSYFKFVKNSFCVLSDTLVSNDIVAPPPPTHTGVVSDRQRSVSSAAPLVRALPMLLVIPGSVVTVQSAFDNRIYWTDTHAHVLMLWHAAGLRQPKVGAVGLGQGWGPHG